MLPFLSFFLFPTCTCVNTHAEIAQVAGRNTVCSSPSNVGGETVRWGAEHKRVGVGTPAGLSSPSTALGICGVTHCLVPSLSAAPGLEATLYLKPPEAYVSLIFAKANPSFLSECSKPQIQEGCSAQGVRRFCGFACLCSCASAAER